MQHIQRYENDSLKNLYMPIHVIPELKLASHYLIHLHDHFHWLSRHVNIDRTWLLHGVTGCWALDHVRQPIINMNHPTRHTLDIKLNKGVRTSILDEKNYIYITNLGELKTYGLQWCWSMTCSEFRKLSNKLKMVYPIRTLSDIKCQDYVYVK